MDIKGSIQQLQELKRHYLNGSVSLLVGAGFSKNAYDGYPSWDGLLSDMVSELYPGRDVAKMIAKKGYLGIVSEYGKRKGHREYIESYIEEQIPYIAGDKLHFCFQGKNSGKEVLIDNALFSAHRKLLDGKWKKIYTTNYDRLLEYAAELDGKKYSAIVSSSQLSECPKETIPIVKLHGDLYHPDETRRFQFDGDNALMYIITKEDYKTYPKKHKGFNEIMHTSLLEGVFCLIGFSGEDQNFKGWIEWLRDELTKEDTSGKNSYKVFLVTPDNQLLDYAKELYFENHRVCFIPLKHPDVLKELNSTATEKRDILVDFFRYLYDEPLHSSATGSDSEELQKKYSYPTLWRKLDSDLSDTPADKQQAEHEQLAAQIISLKPQNRIVRTTYYQEEFLEKQARKKGISKTDANLCLIAMQETGLPFSHFPHLADVVGRSLAAGKRKHFQELWERSELLSAKTLTDMSGLTTHHQRVLKALFSLNFKDAKWKLKQWRPSGTDILKKALYQSFFDPARAKKQVDGFIKKTPLDAEKFFATRLLNILENSFVSAHPTSEFTEKGVPDYLKLFDSIVRDLTSKKEEIKPYGVGKSKVVYLDGGPGDVDYPKAMAILNFLIEAPLPISYRNFYTIRNSADWYKVHREIFEKHPFAALYYGLQCTDKNVKTRIGQDYAYSDKLASTCLPEILVNLLSAYLSEETPFFLKSSILRIAKEILIAVNPSHWEALFMRIWREKVISNISGLNDPRFPELEQFVFQGLDSMQSLENRVAIIADILSHSNEDGGFVINALYYLDKKGIDRSALIADLIDSFVSGINKPWQIVVAGNLHDFLSEDNKKTVREKISALLDTESFSDIEFGSSTNFVHPEDLVLQQKLVRSIYLSPLLWHTGVHSDGHYSSGDNAFLALSSYKHIRLSPDDIVAFYGKLKDSLSQIASSRVFSSPFYHMISLEDSTLEMLIFLERYKDYLGKQADYVEVRERVAKIYQRAVDFHAVEDGLLSVYSEELENALAFMYKNRRALEHSRFLTLLNLILTRIMMFNSDGLDICLRYMRYFVADGAVSPLDKATHAAIIMMLDKTTPERLTQSNINLAHAANNLTVIANKMEEWGYESSGIAFWKKYATKHRFYTNYI